MAAVRMIFFSFLVSFALTACDTPAGISPPPTFTIVNKEETMPVWVHGAPNSLIVLVVVHGGPGADVLSFRNYKEGTAFRKIEEQFLVVYWQQRSSGQSLGPDKNEYLTIEQYVQDLDKLIDEVNIRYPNKKLVMYGHSWGGMLSIAYLKDTQRKTKISAWINSAGIHNGVNLFGKAIQDMNAEADKRIKQNENVSYWEDVKSQLATDPDAAVKLSYYLPDKIPEIKVKVNVYEDAKYSLRSLLSNQRLFQEVLLTNHTSVLANLNLPTLLLWGLYDYTVSRQLREEVITTMPSNLITPVDFNASGHSTIFTEPDLYADSIINFLSRFN